MFTSSHQLVVASPAPRVSGARRELFSSEGWRLLTGPERIWQIELDADGGGRDRSDLWSEIQRTLALLARADCVRPLVIDMRGCPRLEQDARWAMSTLISRYEEAGVRLALICEVDLVQVVRVQSLLGHCAPTLGRRVLSMGEAIAWVRSGPVVAAPVRPAA